ncbi:MAG: YHS domain-containing protein [Candidatus Omnitrophica bacterium]|nr:YHS domain-containing protein [Candidatus Omnitrophota bacterium]
MVYAVPETFAATANQENTSVVDEGNKTCPVSGLKVGAKDFYTYKGKRYGLCCPMCSTAFSADPAKYAAIADKEVTEKN